MTALSNEELLRTVSTMVQDMGQRLAKLEERANNPPVVSEVSPVVEAAKVEMRFGDLDLSRPVDEIMAQLDALPSGRLWNLTRAFDELVKKRHPGVH